MSGFQRCDAFIDPVAMVAARLLMRYWLISGSTSLAKFRNDSCHPR